MTPLSRRLRALSRRHVIGLDLGSSFMKLLMLERTADGLSIEGSGLFCPALTEGDSDTFSPETIARVRSLLKREGLAGLPAAANIEDTSLRIRRVDLPKLPADEIIAAARWSLRDYVDGDIDDYAVRTTPLQARPEGSLSVVAYAIKREAVARQCALIRQLGLVPITIEPSAVSLLRLCDYTYGWRTAERYALLDFGTKVSAFTVMERGTLLFSRPLSGICEQALVKLLSRNLDLTLPEASDRLWHYRNQATANPSPAPATDASMSKLDPDSRVAVTMHHYFSQILLEIERSIDAFCMMFQAETAGPLYITGGASYLPKLLPYLTSELHTPIYPLNPFEHFRLGDRQHTLLSPIFYLFAVSAGLALLAQEAP